MKRHTSLIWVFLNLIIFVFILINHCCHAKEAQPISESTPRTKQSPINTTHHWWSTSTSQETVPLKSTAHLAISGALCFIAASISSAGGIGGGGLFIPILTIVAGLGLKTASGFSALMVTGGSIANVLCNICTSRKLGGKSLIDYDIALLSEPCLLLGVSIGVICNVVFPEWLITILFAIFLGCSTFTTCNLGVLRWKMESEAKGNGDRNVDNGLVRDEICYGSEGVESNINKDTPLGGEVKWILSIPWRELWVLVMILISFIALNVLPGNPNGQIIKLIKPCGVAYWIVSSLQIPLAVIFTTWIYLRTRSLQDQTSNQQETGDQTRGRISYKLIFPAMALSAGTLGGVFGIGGGMLISPLLFQVGITPEVTSATCSLLVLLSSTMSSIQYLLLGLEHTNIAIIFAVLCFVAALVGSMVVKRAIAKHERASLIVFAVGTVMAVSTVLITSYGALHVSRDYKSGRNMGFTNPC